MAKKFSAVIVFLCFILAGAAAGQDRVPGRGQAPGARMGQRGGRVRENLATLRLLRLTQALDLTEDQAAKIFPVINKIEREKIEVQRSLSGDIQDLRKIVAAGAPVDADLAPLIAKINAAQKRVKQLDAESEAFLETNLSVVQRGKYILFQIDFYRALEQAALGLKPQRGAGAVIK
jgi:Spy/CpxP family protein refolding chaperone